MHESVAQPAAAGHPAEMGVIGVGALASAIVVALARVWPSCRFHLSPRGAATSLQLADRIGAQRHDSNQAVADACGMLLIGVRPAQLAALADELRLRPEHHLLALSAGTPLATFAPRFAPARVTRLMTGLAVAGGQSAISVFPQAEDVASLLAPACASVLGFDTEARFDASILAVCANAWWLDQLAALSDWMVQATGMAPEQAQALLCANLADVASMLRLHPGCGPRELARSVGSPGTYTALGLDHLQQQQAHRVWQETLAQVFDRLRDSAA